MNVTAYRDIGRDLCRLLRQFYSIHARHHDIGEQQIVFSLSGIGIAEVSESAASTA